MMLIIIIYIIIIIIIIIDCYGRAPIENPTGYKLKMPR